MQAQKSKIASNETQLQRGKNISRALFFFIFVLVMSIPLLDILAGFAIILYMPMLIFARSAQRAVDFGWLLLGAVICMFGFFLPGIFEGPTSSGFFHGWLLDGSSWAAASAICSCNRQATCEAPDNPSPCGRSARVRPLTRPFFRPTAGQIDDQTLSAFGSTLMS
jgi:hypothetical protein